MKKKGFVNEPAPILNVPDFAQVFQERTPSHLLPEMEYIALRGTPFAVIREFPEKKSLQVLIKQYPSNSPLFVDERFVTFEDKPYNKKNILSAYQILENLSRKIGLPYIWGGNYANGIERMLEIYPQKKALTEKEKEIFIFKGCDCSGLIFESTEGYTPRNVSWMLSFGKKIPPEAQEMLLLKLRPLDALLWPGHCVFYFGDRKTIESKNQWGGVVLMEAKERIQRIFEERGEMLYNEKDCTEHHGFVVRRWHPTMEKE